MNSDFLITSIDRIILVEKDSFPETHTKFTSDLFSHELIYHFSGKATVLFNYQTLITVENSIRFLPKGKNLQYDVFHEEHGMCIDIFFQTDQPVANHAFVLDYDEVKQVSVLFTKIFSVWTAKREGYYFECISLLYQIFAQLQKRNYVPKDKLAYIAPAIEYIQNHFSKETISSQKLEQLCGISYSYIKQLFSQQFGVSPKKYILQMKLHYAADLLSSGLYTVNQVAYLCSYQEVSFFCRQFKQQFGETPTDYVKIARFGR